MTWPVVIAVAVAVLATGWVRAQVFIHSVPVGQPWRTACPHCGRTMVTARYGWAWLPRSRCPHCGNRIGPHTGLVEAVTVSAAGALAWTVHDPLALTAFLVFAAAGTALTFIDLAVHRLPDRLTLPALTATGLLLTVDAAWQHRLGALVTALASAAGSAAVYLVLALIADGGMGDVKLSLGTGLILGWHGLATVVFGVLAGFAFTSLSAAAMVAAGRLKRGDHIAHAPGMLLAALAVTTAASALL